MAKRLVLSPGQKVLSGRYEILKVIHTKGMSSVYLASDSNLNKQWCLKEIRKSQSGKDMVEYYSLLQEADIMKGLNHPSIPRITSIERSGDSVFIIMDYVDGISVKSWLLRKGKIKQDVVVAWMKQLTSVMIYLHNRKEPIFYRDMKPDNVMIQSDGNIKLLDFGISLVLKEKGSIIKQALGTPGYAAPEQSKKGLPCDLRSDIYSMGMTMYYMLTGLNPNQLYVAEEPIRPIREIDSSISIGLEKIFKKCTRENPDERYQTCEELLYALQNYTSLDTKYRRKIRQKCALVITLFILSIFTLVGSFIPYSLNRSQQSEEYRRLKVVANQTGRSGDFEALVNANPLDLVSYKGYIESLKLDGKFTKAEESSLLGFVNIYLEKLKQEKGYSEIAFEIGKLYWFYYEGTTADEGAITSVKWFKDAKDLGYKPELADVYYKLGSFKKGISSSVTEASDGGMYKEYWNNLVKAKGIDSGELINLQLNMAIASCISTYAYNLKLDGISKADVMKEVKDLENYVKNYNPSLEKAKETYSSLKQTLGSIEMKVNSVYGTESGGAN